MTIGPLQIPADFWDRDDVHDALNRRSLGAVLLLVNVHCNMSQTRIAAGCDLSQGVVSTIMRGKRTVNAIRVLDRIAEGLTMPDHARVLFGLAPLHREPATPQPRPVPSIEVTARAPEHQTFGAAVRTLRESSGLSLAGLAHRANYSRAILGHIETGYRIPTREIAAALDRAFNTNGYLIELAATARAAQRQSDSPGHTAGGHEAIAQGADIATEVVSDHMRRRTLMTWGLTAATAGMLGDDERQRVVAVRAEPSRIDLATIGHIEAVMHHCRRQEDTLGPTAVLGTVSAQRQLVLSVLPHAPDDLQARLLTVLANICRSIGWMLFNLNDFAGADHYFAQARSAAHQADDDAMTSFVLANWSQLATWRGDPREGVEHALGALAWGQRAGSRVLASYAWDVGARAYAAVVRHSAERNRAGDHASCMRSLDQAGHELAAVDESDQGATLLHFYDEGLHQSTRTLCLLELHDTARALPLAQHAVDHINPDFVRNLAFARLDLARAHTQTREARSIEAAADEIAEAASLSRYNTSPRLATSVTEARRALEPWSASRAVAELDERLLALNSSR